MDSDYIYVHLDPTHQRANGNLKYFEYQLAKQKKVETEEEEEEEAEGRWWGVGGCVLLLAVHLSQSVFSKAPSERRIKHPNACGTTLLLQF